MGEWPFCNCAMCPDCAPSYPCNCTIEGVRTQLTAERTAHATTLRDGLAMQTRAEEAERELGNTQRRLEAAEQRIVELASANHDREAALQVTRGQRMEITALERRLTATQGALRRLVEAVNGGVSLCNSPEDKDALVAALREAEAVLRQESAS